MAIFTPGLTPTLPPGPDDFLFGSQVGEEIPGFSGDDIIFGMAGNDILNGDAGSDRLEGDSGMDRINGGLDDDLLIGGTDNEMGAIRIPPAVPEQVDAGLFGEGGDDVLFGNAGNDMLNGGEDNDQLFGGSGGDVLDGSLGDDFYTGGSGRDLFIWDSDEGGFDTITDFQNGMDTIEEVLLTNHGLRQLFGTVINSADRGVGFVNVPGPFDEGGMLIIDFRPDPRLGVLTVQGVHELDVGTDIV